jgi:hypothetical protein
MCKELPLREDFFECRSGFAFVFFIEHTKTKGGGIVYKNRLFMPALPKVPLDKNTMP